MNHPYITHEQHKKNNQGRKTLSLHPLVDYLDSYIHHDTVTKADLKSKITLIYDQGQIGSCTANSCAQAMRMCPKYSDFLPSRLYIYAKERIMEGETTLSDSGADSLDGLIQLKNHGVCPESLWPYDINNLNILPSSICDTEAEKYKVHTIGRVCKDNCSVQDKINAIKKSILAGISVLIGISVFDGFESENAASTGIIPMPETSQDVLGGHEILLVGFDDLSKQFCFVNSWGESWGDHGYGYLPYDYVTDPNLTSEFIMITSA